MNKRWMVTGLVALSLTLLAGQASAHDRHDRKDHRYDRGNHKRVTQVRDQGRWHHGVHNGRDGIWRIVGNFWTYYGPRPVQVRYIQPSPYSTIIMPPGPVVRYVYTPY